MSVGGAPQLAASRPCEHRRVRNLGYTVPIVAFLATSCSTVMNRNETGRNAFFKASGKSAL